MWIVKEELLALAQKWDDESEERAGYADQRLDEEHYHTNNTMSEVLSNCADSLRAIVERAS